VSEGRLTHRHASGIESFTLERDEPIPALALTLMLQALAENCGEKLLRFKGLVHIAEMPDRPAVVHGVNHIFYPPTWLDHWPGENRSTQMIFIGTGIPRHWPKQLLELASEEVSLEVARHANVRMRPISATENLAR
jgi:G3E family GTPase